MNIYEMEDDDGVAVSASLACLSALLGLMIALVGFAIKALSRIRDNTGRWRGVVQSDTVKQTMTKLELMDELRGVFIYQVMTAAIAKTAKSSMKDDKSMAGLAYLAVFVQIGWSFFAGTDTASKFWPQKRTAGMKLVDVLIGLASVIVTFYVALWGEDQAADDNGQVTITTTQ